MDVKAAFLNLLYPEIERCFFCGAEFQGELCPSCREKLAPLYLGNRPYSLGSLACVSLYQYAGPVRAAIYTMKFDHIPWKALALGKMLASVSVPFDDIDAITFVPVHDKRKAKRGFDQAALLAQGLGQAICKPVIPTLVKVKHTAPQSKLSAQERAKNILGAFSLLPHVDIAGKNILLVDDVITTGGTIVEAAQVLTSAGANVQCASLACTQK